MATEKELNKLARDLAKKQKLIETSFRKLETFDLAQYEKKARLHPDVLSQSKYKEAIELQTKAKNRELRLGEFEEIRKSWPYLEPLVVGIIMLFLFIGPGTTLIGSLFFSLNPLMWVAIIFLLLMIWRNK